MKVDSPLWKRGVRGDFIISRISITNPPYPPLLKGGIKIATKTTMCIILSITKKEMLPFLKKLQKTGRN